MSSNACLVCAAHTPAVPFGHISLQTSNPDRASGIRSSIAVDSEMDEFAFTAAFEQLLRCGPDISIVHVPSQLCAMWKHYPHMGGGCANDLGESAAGRAAAEITAAAAAAFGTAAAATAIMPTTAMAGAGAVAAAAAAVVPESSLGAWLQSHRAQLQSARYLAFHWSCGHFCSVLVDLDVWRAGPMDKPAAVSGDAQFNASAARGVAVLAEAAAAAGLSSPAESTACTPAPPAKRQRRSTSRAQREAQHDARSCCELPVPLLHLDTLPDACGFLADRAALLRSVCVELNKLFDTQWPVRSMQQLRSHVYLCGPSMQTDTWSCGYRLLHGWAAVLAVMRETSSVTPYLLNRVCNLAEQQTSLQQMIDQAIALFDAAGAHEEVHSQCCLHLLHAWTVSYFRCSSPMSCCFPSFCVSAAGK